MTPPSRTTNSSSKAENRSPLTKERIVEAAIIFADEHGIDGLSMRKLAAELGAGAMSLYNHVANKDELLAAMVDVVIAEMEPPALDGDSAEAWRNAMRASATSTHDAYLRHGWAITAAMSSPPGPQRLEHMEAVLAAFAHSGLEPDTAHHAYHAYEVHISGFVLSQLAFGFTNTELKALAADYLTTLDTERLPYVAAHVKEHLHDRDSDFEFGLDLLLDGFERLRT